MNVVSLPELFTIAGLMFVGGAVLASLYWYNKLTLLRIYWIRVEHSLARAEGREPRNIDEVVS